MREQARQMINHENSEIRFVANVILNQHRNPARKLRGLAELVAKGYSVRTAQFDIDRLIVDGKLMPWENLETLN